MKEIANRLDNISFIKTIMMITVVLYHCFLFFGGNWFTPVEPVQSADYLYNIAQWMKTFHIQAFAMASGFLFYYLMAEKGRYNDPKNDIKKRAKRLLIPYLFTSILWVIPIGIFFYHYSFGEIFSKFILMTGPAQLWFLIMLFMVFLFFELIGKRIKLSFGNLVLIYIITTMVGGLLSRTNISYFQLAASVKYILFFYLGGYIYKNRKKISWKQVLPMIVVIAVLYALIVCFGKSDNTVIKYGVDFVKPLLSVLEVSVIYFICSRLVQKCKGIVNNRFYKVLEGNSFGIYLFHQQIVYFVIFWLNGTVPPIVLALCSFVIALSVSLVMSFVLRRNKVTRFMFGL